jgi:uncharacterized protein (TIGR02246 family)
MGAETEIPALVQAYVDAWNQHDADKFAALFAEDADVTSAQGATLHGRAAVHDQHKKMFQGRFRSSHRTADPPKIRSLTPDLAGVDVPMRFGGVAGPDGTPRPDRPVLAVWVVAHGPTGWSIVIAHESNLPAPPVGPSAAGAEPS